MISLPFCVLFIFACFRLRKLKAVIENVNILSSDKISHFFTSEKLAIGVA